MGRWFHEMMASCVQGFGGGGVAKESRAHRPLSKGVEVVPSREQALEGGVKKIP
jgi:hypothetical protein